MGKRRGFNRPRIVALLSGVRGLGGIQRYNRTFCKALSEYSENRRISLDILSLHDPHEWYDGRYLARPLVGCNGNRLTFAMRSLAALSKPCGLAIIGHVDLGPFILPRHVLRRHTKILVLTYGREAWGRLPLHKRWALYAADLHWPISEYTGGQLISEQGVPPASITVVPVPLDPDFYEDASLRRAGWCSVTHPSLLTISRMNTADSDKGIDHVITALPAVRAQVPDVNYVVVGDGTDRPRLEHLAAKHNVTDIVQFAGRVSDEQLHAYLHATDVFVLPSRKEGFGIVFLEAMAYGKPVVAGAHGGSPEVVADGETGILVRNGDQDALVEALTSLLLNPEMRRKMGDAGMHRVQTVFSYDQFQSEVNQSLDRLLVRP